MTETNHPARGTRLRHRAAAALICAAILAACGGGGGGGDGGGGGGGGGGGTTPHSIGGRVEGLTGAGLVLRNNGGNDLAVGAAGAFRFTQTVAHGGAYAVTVFTQPAGQACIVAHGSGTANDDVSNIVVTCANNPPPPPPQTQTVGGSVSGLTSAGLVLRNNGGDGITLAADATSFTFPTAVARGAAYAVTIGTQPQGNDCTLANASGTIAEANVSNVQVSCGPVGPLTLVSSNPAANATNLPRDVVPGFTFSTPLDAASIGAAAQLRLVMPPPEGTMLPVQAEPAAQGGVLSLQPTRKLLPGSLYTMSVSAGLRGARGEMLAAPLSQPFTTADAAWAGGQDFGALKRAPDTTYAAVSASNKAGDTVVAWIESATAVDTWRVMARVYRAATGQWGPAEELQAGAHLPAGNGLPTQLVAGVADNGDSHVAWFQPDSGGHDTPRTRHRPVANGVWGAVHDFGRIGSDLASTQAMLVQPDGVVRFVWGADNLQLHVASGRPGAWQPPRLLSSDTADPLARIRGFPQWVALPTGGAMAVWEEGLSNTQAGLIRARRVDAAGVPVGEAVTLSPMDAIEVAKPSVAVQQVDNHTRVYVAWRRVTADQDGILVQRWSSLTDAWDDRLFTFVGTVPRNERVMGSPVVVAPAGSGTSGVPAQVVWAEMRLADRTVRLRGAQVLPSGAPPEATVLLDAAGQLGSGTLPPFTPPAATVDRAGNLLVVYSHASPGSGGSTTAVPRALRRLARGTQWNALDIEAAPSHSTAVYPQLVGASETGSAWALWGQQTNASGAASWQWRGRIFD